MIPQPVDYKIHYDKYNDDKCTKILTIFIIRTKNKNKRYRSYQFLYRFQKLRLKIKHGYNKL